jgi:hypothetical protein
MANAPITSSAAATTSIEQQLADVIAAKEAALANLTAFLESYTTTGIGPSWANAGEGGSESVNWTGYLAELRAEIDQFAQLEQTLLQLLQDLNPYTIRQRQRITERIGHWRW